MLSLTFVISIVVEKVLVVSSPTYGIIVKFVFKRHQQSNPSMLLVHALLRWNVYWVRTRGWRGWTMQYVSNSNLP